MTPGLFELKEIRPISEHRWSPVSSWLAPKFDLRQSHPSG